MRHVIAGVLALAVAVGAFSAVRAESGPVDDVLGRWRVQTTRVESTDPDLFHAGMQDTWRIRRKGAGVSITNGVKGVERAATVHRGEDGHAVLRVTNVATLKSTRKGRMTEQAELVFTGGAFEGVSESRFEIEPANGESPETRFARYKVVGRRLK